MRNNITGRFVTVLWDNKKIDFLKNNFLSYTKTDLCSILNVSRKALNLKISELRNIYPECFTDNNKRCSICKIKFPKTKEYFSTNICKTGIFFRSACKKCSKTRDNKNQSTIEGYLKSILRCKKYDKREKCKNYSISITYLLKILERQNYKCAITGLDMTYIKGKGFNLSNISIDRIDPNIGYIEGNIQLVRLWANVSKNYLTTEEFKEYILATYKNFYEN